jgi:hypothetical protein
MTARISIAIGCGLHLLLTPDQAAPILQALCTSSLYKSVYKSDGYGANRKFTKTEGAPDISIVQEDQIEKPIADHIAAATDDPTP